MITKLNFKMKMDTDNELYVQHDNVDVKVETWEEVGIDFVMEYFYRFLVSAGFSTSTIIEGLNKFSASIETEE